MSVFTLTGRSYSSSENKCIQSLENQIKESKQISPIIVVMDAKGFYILEGSHRADALYNLGASTVPALIVIDTESVPFD